MSAETSAAIAAQAPTDRITQEIAAWSSQVLPQVKPPKIYARSAAEILADLSKEIAPQHLKSKSKGGNKITFISWYIAVRYLDFFAPGWCSEVRSVNWIQERIVITVRLSIPTAEGWIFREATGTEEDDTDGKMYGTPADHAESSALRRAAAKFGLGLYLYNK